MAVVELTDELEAAEAARSVGLLESELRSEAARHVRIGVHDASRIEWSVSLPLPEGRSALPYSLRVDIQIPHNAFVRHTPWDQMQTFTRLDGPAMTAAAPSDVVTIDQLRRGALAMASQLARASDGFARHCLLAGSLFATA